MIGRLDRQKGFDLLAEAAPALLERGFRLAVLGVGQPRRRRAARERRRVARPGEGRIALVERFDRDLARRMYAGADGFLMPSRFEPCGTGQMIALRYGTPPIVRATGGLRDTVIDVDRESRRRHGLRLRGRSPDGTSSTPAPASWRASDQAAPAWEALLDRGMAVDFDWRSASAPAYLAAYRRAIALRARVASR